MMPGVGKEIIAEMPPPPLSDRDRIAALESAVGQLQGNEQVFIHEIQELRERVRLLESGQTNVGGVAVDMKEWE